MSIKDRLLGMPHGTATHRLRKAILFDLIQRFDLDQCFQCDKQIEGVDDLSIEHKKPWQRADDPKVTFFDVENIAFSHISCNISAGARQDREQANHCRNGHPYTLENTRQAPPQGRTRLCRECLRIRRRRYREEEKAKVAQG